MIKKIWPLFRLPLNDATDVLFQGIQNHKFGGHILGKLLLGHVVFRGDI